jgi:hypothetical protein
MPGASGRDVGIQLPLDSPAFGGQIDLRAVTIIGMQSGWRRRGRKAGRDLGSFVAEPITY